MCPVLSFDKSSLFWILSTGALHSTEATLWFSVHAGFVYSMPGFAEASEIDHLLIFLHFTSRVSCIPQFLHFPRIISSVKPIIIFPISSDLALFRISQHLPISCLVRVLRLCILPVHHHFIPILICYHGLHQYIMIITNYNFSSTHGLE